MWVVGSPANAFDPDLYHFLAKIQKHWQSYNVQGEDAKCCFNWPALQGSQDTDTMSLQTHKEEVNNTPLFYYPVLLVVLLPFVFISLTLITFCVERNQILNVYHMVFVPIASPFQGFLSAHHSPIQTWVN